MQRQFLSTSAGTAPSNETPTQISNDELVGFARLVCESHLLSNSFSHILSVSGKQIVKWHKKSANQFGLRQKTRTMVKSNVYRWISPQVCVMIRRPKKKKTTEKTKPEEYAA